MDPVVEEHPEPKPRFSVTVHTVKALDGRDLRLRYTEIQDGDIVRCMVEIWYPGGSSGYPDGAPEAYFHVQAWMRNGPGSAWQAWPGTARPGMAWHG